MHHSNKLICSANQLAGFYTRTKMVVQGLKLFPEQFKLQKTKLASRNLDIWNFCNAICNKKFEYNKVSKTVTMSTMNSPVFADFNGINWNSFTQLDFGFAK